tara:strand:- start:280 stop:1626 length:1347 start_codon:yes stop_codon:yes gene_type:complete
MALFSISFLVLGWFVHWQTLSFMEQELRSAIDQELTRAREFYDAYGVERFIGEIEEEVARDPTSFYMFLDSQCDVIAGDRNRLDTNWSTQELCEQAKLNEGWLLFELTIPRGFRAEIPEWDDDVYARLGSLSENHSLIFGRMGGNIDSARQVMEDALIWGLGAMIALAILSSYLMAGSVGNRLEKLNRASLDIRLGNLSQRMPQSRSNDEFDSLAGNLNDMLDQIQSLMVGVRSVSDSIAHDLRTPLTRLRNQLEQLYKSSHADIGPMVEKSIDEADRMLSTFNAILRIAEIEAGNRRMDHGEVNIVEVLKDVTDLYEPLAAEKNVILKCHAGDCSAVVGDRDLMFQAVSNLVDNAIKYTPQEGNVDLSLEENVKSVRLLVSDSGPGIPENEREKVFDRFYRLDEHRDSIGNGLGLSLVNAVARSHHTQVLLESNDPGLRVVWNLKRC